MSLVQFTAVLSVVTWKTSHPQLFKVQSLETVTWKTSHPQLFKVQSLKTVWPGVQGVFLGDTRVSCLKPDLRWSKYASLYQGNVCHGNKDKILRDAELQG